MVNIVSKATGIYEWNPLSKPATAFSPASPFDKESKTPKTNEHPLKWVTEQVKAASTQSKASSTVQMYTLIKMAMLLGKSQF